MKMYNEVNTHTQTKQFLMEMLSGWNGHETCQINPLAVGTQQHQQGRRGSNATQQQKPQGQ